MRNGRERFDNMPAAEDIASLRLSGGGREREATEPPATDTLFTIRKGRRKGLSETALGRNNPRVVTGERRPVHRFSFLRWRG